jgi:uncharacterized protein
MRLNEKVELVKQECKAAAKVVLAYSGGVDSSVLARIGKEAIGDQMILVTIDNGLQSRYDLDAAQDMALYLGLPHEIIKIDALQCEEIRANQPERCYHCKKLLLGQLIELARKSGSQVMEGSHREDERTHRPGKYAIAELGIMSPLLKAGLDKAEIRTLAHDYGLPNWNSPASPCLATRFPYGHFLSPVLLKRVEKAEDILRQTGLREFRVRCHGDLARIEVAPDERQHFFNLQIMDDIDLSLRKLGFTHVSLDMCGYRCGSMDTA